MSCFRSCFCRKSVLNRSLMVVITWSLIGGCVSAQKEEETPEPQEQRDFSESYYKRGEGDPGGGGASSSNGGRSAAAAKSGFPLDQPVKKRVGVFLFWNDTRLQSGALGGSGAEILKKALRDSNMVLVGDPQLPEWDTVQYVTGDQVKVSQLLQEGRKAGLGVVVIGRLSRMVFRQKGDEIGLLRNNYAHLSMDIELKAFSVSNGREIFSQVRTVQSRTSTLAALESGNAEKERYQFEIAEKALQEKIPKMTPDLLRAIERMTWEGRIVQAVGNRFTVNAGKETGLVVGDILRVLTPGQDVYDPGQGAFLGRSEGMLKGTLEIVEFVGQDGAVGRLHTGGQMREGDLVRLY